MGWIAILDRTSTIKTVIPSTAEKMDFKRLSDLAVEGIWCCDPQQIPRSEDKFLQNEIRLLAERGMIVRGRLLSRSR